jgi:Zn-dependent protease
VDAERLATGLTSYVVLLFSLSFHEAAHAWMARHLGDDTAESEGRISLNPLVHIDPLGTFLIPMLQIFWGGIPMLAWAKPTPYNPARFDRQHSLRRGHILVASAGPVSNLFLALVFTGALMVAANVPLETTKADMILTLLFSGVSLNVALAVFNFVPIPPLDGSKVASFGLPRHIGDRYDRVMEPYGHFILLLLVMTGAIRFIVGPIIVALHGFLIRLAY